MKDYDTISRNLRYPAKPKKAEPKREDFHNNATWGAALDAYEVEFANQMAAYGADLETYHSQAQKVDQEFWNELYEDLGWDRLPTKIASALQTRAWDAGHSAGYNEVYNYAIDYGTLVDAILEELRK
jgi:hypothetical protein